MIGDSALYGLSASIGKALALLTVPYLTRALTPSGYGVADLATATAALLTLLVMFAGDIPAARKHGTATDDAARSTVLASYVWATCAIGLAATLILLPLAPLIAGTLWSDDGLSGLALLTLVLVPISAVQAALVQVQRLRSRPAAFAALSLVDLLAQLGLAVALVAAGLGPAGVVLGFIAGSVIGLGAAAVAARDTIRIRPDRRLAGELVATGARFLPHVAMFVVADWALRSVVANAIGQEGVAELGLAIRVASVLSLLGAAFAMAWGPIGLARVHDRATAMLFGRVLTAYGVASIACALVLAATGPELLAVVAGPGYEGAAFILPGIALAYAISGTEYVLVVAAGISDRGSRVALAATSGAAVQFIAAIALVPALGAAAIGPLAVLGRSVSFAILLTTVRSSIVAPLSWMAGFAVIALALFGAIHLGMQDEIGWVSMRWAIALAVTVASIALAVRLVRVRPAAAS